MTRLAAAPVREGDLLAGKYRVERVLGVGGMGIVVAARHEELGQMVAIKFVRDDALDNDEAVQRFLREARAAVKLKSEHVARVLDVGKLESGAPYMVMEYLEGSDLAKVLSDHGPMDCESAADWILQACEAVAEAHAAGIVHRDLKPENLFLMDTVGGSQKIKVLDFGVSKAMEGSSGGAMSSLTRTRAMLGSPLYMAPEQMRSSRDVDARADVWALGVVLFQLLTQRWPFEAETMPELCLKVVTEPPIALASLRSDLPPELVATVERCIEKEPAKRFANAAELATALEPFVPPESRIIAERARLAMEPRVPGTSRLSRQVSRVPTPSSPGAGVALVQSSPSPVSAPAVAPGTSAAWGTERTAAGALPDARRSRALPVAVGALLLGVAGTAALVLMLRGGGQGAVPASPSNGVIAASPVDILPPAVPSAVRLSPPPGVPAVTASPSGSAVPTSPGTSAVAAVVARPALVAVPPGSPSARAPIAPARLLPTATTAPRAPGNTPGIQRQNGQDEDIPTIR